MARAQTSHWEPRTFANPARGQRSVSACQSRKPTIDRASLRRSWRKNRRLLSTVSNPDGASHQALRCGSGHSVAGAARNHRSVQLPSCSIRKSPESDAVAMVPIVELASDRPTTMPRLTRDPECSVVDVKDGGHPVPPRGRPDVQIRLELRRSRVGRDHVDPLTAQSTGSRPCHRGAGSCPSHLILQAEPLPAAKPAGRGAIGTARRRPLRNNRPVSPVSGPDRLARHRETRT